METARVKVHHWPFFPDDDLAVCPVNAFDSRLQVIRHRLVQVQQNVQKTFGVGRSLSHFSISSSFILLFVLIPFFFQTERTRNQIIFSFSNKI